MNIKIMDFFFNLYNTCQFDLVTFQMLNSHIRLVATISNSINLEHCFNSAGRIGLSHFDTEIETLSLLT